MVTLTITVYIVFIVVAAYVRVYTEGGFWQAIHTGRTFMLQAATLCVGTGLAHLDHMARFTELRAVLPKPLSSQAEKLLTSPLGKILATPELIFLVGALFIVLYIITGFPEGRYLEPVGNPRHARKYVSDVNQEPTVGYKTFIIFILWLGFLSLLVAWYFILDRDGQGPWSYITTWGLYANLGFAVLLLVGYSCFKRRRGTEGRRQHWDIDSIPGDKD